MTNQNVREQIENLDRVKTKISKIVIRFLEERGEGNDFHMQDLQEYVSKLILISPDSPSRILRNLKKKGEIDYKVICRRQSHYKFYGFKNSTKHNTLKELLANLKFDSLDQYFASAIWNDRKIDYYSKNPKVCFITGATDNIQLHHITYERIGNELDEDLIPLGKFWHEYLHHIVKEYRIKLDIAHLVINKVYRASSSWQTCS